MSDDANRHIRELSRDCRKALSAAYQSTAIRVRHAVAFGLAFLVALVSLRMAAMTPEHSEEPGSGPIIERGDALRFRGKTYSPVLQTALDPDLVTPVLASLNQQSVLTLAGVLPITSLPAAYADKIIRIPLDKEDLLPNLFVLQPNVPRHLGPFTLQGPEYLYLANYEDLLSVRLNGVPVESSTGALFFGIAIASGDVLSVESSEPIAVPAFWENPEQTGSIWRQYLESNATGVDGALPEVYTPPSLEEPMQVQSTGVGQLVQTLNRGYTDWITYDTDPLNNPISGWGISISGSTFLWVRDHWGNCNGFSQYNRYFDIYSGEALASGNFYFRIDNSPYTRWWSNSLVECVNDAESDAESYSASQLRPASFLLDPPDSTENTGTLRLSFWDDHLVGDHEQDAVQISLGTDYTAPTQPTVSSPGVTTTSISLALSSTDARSGVYGFQVWRGGALLPGEAKGFLKIFEGNPRSVVATGLAPSTTYTFTIYAFDLVGNRSTARNVSYSTAATCTSFSISPTSSNPSYPAATSGTGSGSVTVTWTENTSTSSRSGTATIAGNSFGVTQGGTTPVTCTSFSISPTSSNPSYPAGQAVVTVTGSPAGCTGGSWSASESLTWLSLSPTSGTGSGSVTVTWTENTSTSSRSGTATIAGNTFNVTQSGTQAVSALSCGSQAGGRLDLTDRTDGHRGSGYYTDVFTFTGMVGQTYVLDLTSSEFDTYLYLVSPSGTVAASNDDWAGTLNSHIEFTLTETGTWTVEATSFAGATGAYSLLMTGCPPAPTLFSTVTPCRVLDTRNASGPLGGPILGANEERTFVLAGSCSIPANAQALAATVTAVGPSAGGELLVYPEDASPEPVASTLAFQGNRTRLVSTYLKLSASGAIRVRNRSAAPLHVIVDVNGFFAPMEGVLLSENFNDGDAAGWTELISGWQVSGGVYQATNHAASVDTESYWSGGMAWTNYTATTRIMLENTYTPSAGFLRMRYQAPNNMVDCQLVDATPGMSLVLSYATPGGGAVIQEKVIGFAQNTWYTLRGTAIGSSFSCEVLEIPGSQVAGSAPLAPSSGTVALRNAHIDVSFDDVSVVAAP